MDELINGHWWQRRGSQKGSGEGKRSVRKRSTIKYREEKKVFG